MSVVLPNNVLNLNYTTTGAFSPNENVDYSLEEIGDFPLSSLGKLKTYKDSLYLSVDPIDDTQSSKIYKYTANIPTEQRSVLALTSTNITCVLIDPNRNSGLFSSSGKFFGSDKGLQYAFGGKLNKYASVLAFPTPSGDLLTNCAGSCSSYTNGVNNQPEILVIDTTGESGAKYYKYLNSGKTDDWGKVNNADGWTIDARVKIENDGYGGSLSQQSINLLLNKKDCKTNQTNISTSDGSDDTINALGIIINDGTYEEVIQLFENGIRLKYANSFVSCDLESEFNTIRIIGKNNSIAVFLKPDSKTDFQRIIYLPNGLKVKSIETGDQENPNQLVDQFGNSNLVWQDSENTDDFSILYSKTIPEKIIGNGNLFSAKNYPQINIINARPSLGLTAASGFNYNNPPSNAIISGYANFVSWGVNAGDYIVLYNLKDSAFNSLTNISSKKYKIKNVIDEASLILDTGEDLGQLFSNADYIIYDGIDTWARPIKISTEAFESLNPKLLIHSDGSIYCVYQNNSTGENQLYLRKGKIDPLSANWNESILLTNSLNDSSNASFVELPNGNLFITYEEKQADETTLIKYLIFDTSKISLYQSSSGILLASVNNSNAKNSKIALTSSNIIITYQNSPMSGLIGIFATSIDFASFTIQNPIQIDSGSINDCTNPTISTNSSKISISYEQIINNVSQIFNVAGVDDGSGIIWGNSLRIVNSSGNAKNTCSACLDNDNVYLIFQDDRINNVPELYFSKYDANLDEWISSGQNGLDIKLDIDVNYARNPFFDIDNFNNLSIVFESGTDGSRSKINRILYDGVSISTDETITAYFPLNDISGDVKNKIREFGGSQGKSVEYIFLIQVNNTNFSRVTDSAKTLINDLVNSNDFFNILFFNNYLDSNQIYSFYTTGFANFSQKTNGINYINSFSTSSSQTVGNPLITAIDNFSAYTNDKLQILISVSGTKSIQNINNFQTFLQSINQENSTRLSSLYFFSIETEDVSSISQIASNNNGQYFKGNIDNSPSSTINFINIENTMQNQINATRNLFAINPQNNGTVNINGIQDSATSLKASYIDRNLNYYNLDDKGSFDFSTGKCFRIGTDLINSISGTVDFWMSPKFASSEGVERIFFGNAPLSSNSTNIIVFGIQGGNLRFRIGDSSGKEQETSIQAANFSWAVNDKVHLRVTWDTNASGVRTLNKVSFADLNTGYACGNEGYVYKTVDGGITWTKQNSNTRYDLYSIKTITGTGTVLACGEFGTVLLSTDSGVTWTNISINTTEDIRGIAFNDTNTFYVIGTNLAAYSTSNAGLIWTIMPITSIINNDQNNDFNDIIVAGSTKKLIAISNNGNIYVSPDLITLQLGIVYTSSKNNDLLGITSNGINSDSIFVCGENSEVISSTDGGGTWQSQIINFGVIYTPDINSISLAPDLLTLYAVAQNGLLAKSTDQGVTWTICNMSITNGSYKSIDANFDGNGTGAVFVAVGNGGSVVYSSDSGNTQSYLITNGGFLNIYINGKAYPQTKFQESPFSWNPQANPYLYFGDYTSSGANSANAKMSDIVIYNKPLLESEYTRKNLLIWKTTPLSLQNFNSEKRIEWGSISDKIKTKSDWMYLIADTCGAIEPLQLFAWTIQTGLIDNIIHGITTDNQNSLWVATENGISQLDLNAVSKDLDNWINGNPITKTPINRFINYSGLGNGLPIDNINCIACDINGNVLAGCNQGLLFLDRTSQTNSTFMNLTKNDGLVSNRILCLGNFNDLIFAGTDSGLCIFNLIKSSITSTISISIISNLTITNGLPSNNIQCLFIDKVNEYIYVGTDKGVVKIKISNLSVKIVSIILPQYNVLSIFIDENEVLYCGTTNGFVEFNNQKITNYPISWTYDGIIYGIDSDFSGRKWLATSAGLIEINTCQIPSEKQIDSNGLILNENFNLYNIYDGILGQNSITDYKYYKILGNPLNTGSCGQSLIIVTVDGQNSVGKYNITDDGSFIVFDSTLNSSNIVSAFVLNGWQQIIDFNLRRNNLDYNAYLKTTNLRFNLYVKKFLAGTVLLGANSSAGVENGADAMYSIFINPVNPTDTEVITIIEPVSAQVVSSISVGTTSIYTDVSEKIQIISNDLLSSQEIIFPSTEFDQIDEEYLQFTITKDAVVYVVYDSRATSIPNWLRDFTLVKAVYKVTDMETMTDASGEEKLFIALSGTNGAVYDILDPDIQNCDIYAEVIADTTPPQGCATISNVNSLSNISLSLQATDNLTGLKDMQISSRPDFTTNGTDQVPWVPFQPAYNLQLSGNDASSVSDIITLIGTGSVIIQDSTGTGLLIATSNPGKVYTLNKSTNTLSLLFDPNKNTITAMAVFGNYVVIGTETSGQILAWNGTTLTPIILSGADIVSSMFVYNNLLYIGTGNTGKIYTLDQSLNPLLFQSTYETKVTSFTSFSNNLYWSTLNDTVIGGNSFIAVSGASYNSTPPSTSTITMNADMTGSILVGSDIKYKIGGVYYYALCTAITASLLTISGPALSLTAASLQELDYGVVGETLTTTTTDGHRHSIVVLNEATKLSQVNGVTNTVNSHYHTVTNGILSVADSHTHLLNGNQSGKIFKYDPITANTTIVASDRDYNITSLSSTDANGLMFASTYPNGKVLRFISQENVFIKSFAVNLTNNIKLKVIGKNNYVAIDSGIYLFDGQRWQYQGSSGDLIVDFNTDGTLIYILKASLVSTLPLVSNLTSNPISALNKTFQAYVRFRDEAGNISSIKDTTGNYIACYAPSYLLTSTTPGATATSNAINQLHRIIKIDKNANLLSSVSGSEPFYSATYIETEVGIYESEVFNGTQNLIQWISIGWTATAPTGTSITIAVRTAATSSAITSAKYGNEFVNPSPNDISSLSGQYLQFRATLTASQKGSASPILNSVDIQLRTSESIHFFTTNFVLPDALQRGILTYNGTINPPVTDVVFGICGKNSTDFSDYFVINPNKLFDVPADHQLNNLRVGIKLISSTSSVPVVDEFALLFELANDAIIRLGLLGDNGQTFVPVVSADGTRTVITGITASHSHSVTFSSSITNVNSINGQTSINSSHSHAIVNGIIQPTAGHVHSFGI